MVCVLVSIDTCIGPTRVLVSLHHFFFFWDGISHWTWSSSICLNGWTSALCTSACASPQALRLQMCAITHGFFMMELGTQSQVFIISQQHFIDWTISPYPCPMFCWTYILGTRRKYWINSIQIIPSRCSPSGKEVGVGVQTDWRLSQRPRWKDKKRGAFILCPCPGVYFTRLVWGLEPVPEGVKVVASVDPILFPWLWLSVFKQLCLKYPVFFLPTLYSSPLLTLVELSLTNNICDAVLLNKLGIWSQLLFLSSLFLVFFISLAWTSNQHFTVWDPYSYWVETSGYRHADLNQSGVCFLWIPIGREHQG